MKKTLDFYLPVWYNDCRCKIICTQLKETTIKLCPRCKQEKESTCFNKSSTRKDGLNVYCTSCVKEYRDKNKDWLNSNRKNRWNSSPEYREKYLAYHRDRYVNEKDKLREYQTEHYSIPKNKLKYLISQAKSRCAKEGMEFDLDVDKIEIPSHCKYLGTPLTSTHKVGRKATNMSLDRIDSSKGYTMDNVQIISDQANRMKNDATIEQLIAFAKGILESHT